MSCACETHLICVAGKSYPATISFNANGSVRQATYTDENLALQNVPTGAFSFGACPIAAAPVLDVFRITQPLVAGNNIINHGLPGGQVEVEVRNNATGAEISARVVAEAVGSTTIFVPVAVASARISIDA